MKKRIAIFVVLAMVLCLALTGCGQSDKKSENVNDIEESSATSLDGTYWIATHHGSGSNTDKIEPVDGDSDGIVLVFTAVDMSFISCDGIYLKDAKYEILGTRISFDGGETDGVYAIFDNGELTLYSQNGAIWWIMSKTDIDTANAYIEKLLSGTGESFVIPDNFDTGDWSIMDGSNNPDGDYPLGNDESIPDGGAEWEATHGGNSQNSDGTYTWQLGDGRTLTTNINIMDYIDGDNWRVKDMSIDMGLHQAEGYGVISTRRYLSNTMPIVDFQFSSADGYYGDFHIFTYNDAKGENILSFGVTKTRDWQNEYAFNGTDVKVSFDLIVSYAYACEHLLDNQTSDPFAGVLNSHGQSDYLIN